MLKHPLSFLAMTQDNCIKKEPDFLVGSDRRADRDLPRIAGAASPCHFPFARLPKKPRGNRIHRGFQNLIQLLWLMSLLVLLPVRTSFAYEREIKNLSTAMSEKITKAGKKTIAVVDFTDLRGNVTELGRFLAEEFSVALAGAGEGFEVVDRTHLKTLLREHKLGASGLIDPSTAKKLGEIAGVQALITGTLTSFGESVRLAIKILDTGTAKVLYATSGDIAKTKAIEELLAKGIESEPETTSQPTGTADSPPSPSLPSPATFSTSGSKKAGDFVARIIGIDFPTNKTVAVTISFFNNSEKEWKLAPKLTGNTLADNKGNVFIFAGYNGGGISDSSFWSKGVVGETADYKEPGFWERQGLWLNSKSESILKVVFSYKLEPDALGNIFAVNLNLVGFDVAAQKEKPFGLSFTGIQAKAQNPK